jgi:uncharacterized protein
VTTGTVPADWLLSPELAPSVDGVLAPLFAGAAAGVLRLPVCAGCGLALELEQVVCDGCGTARVDWRDCAPTGAVHTVTVVHRHEPGLVVAAGPYVVADVQLASGHRLLMASVGPLDRPPTIGDPVTVAFRDVGGVAVPAFDPIPHTEASR